VAPGVGVNGGLGVARVDSSLVREWACGGEGGGEVVAGSRKCRARVADGDRDEFHPPPVFLEDRNKRGVLLGLLLMSLVATKIPLESYFY
jgi:hypothetical protein